MGAVLRLVVLEVFWRVTSSRNEIDLVRRVLVVVIVISSTMILVCRCHLLVLPNERPHILPVLAEDYDICYSAGLSVVDRCEKVAEVHGLTWPVVENERMPAEEVQY